MTDIQLPLNPTTHQQQQQKGVSINGGKLIAKASNLEIRGGSLISSSHSGGSSNPISHANVNPLTVVTNNELAAANHHNHANRTAIMSSSKRPTGQQTAAAAAAAAAASNGQGTLVSLNIIDFKQVGVVAAPRRREVRNNMSRQQQQQNRYPFVNNNSSAKKTIPIELTLSASRLMLTDENNHPVGNSSNNQGIKTGGGDNIVENIWWPAGAIQNDDHDIILNGGAVAGTSINPANNPMVVDNCCNSLSTTSAAWTASTTGVMSDRSSVYSIDDGGDFDREASHKVNKQLKEIEAILYEQQLVLHPNQLNHHHYQNNNNLNEYREWSHKFPHLRILGNGFLKDENQDTTSRSSIQNNLNSSSIKLIATNNNLLNLSTTNNLLKTNTNASNEQHQTELPSSTTINNKFTRRRENTDLNNQGIYLNGQSMPIRKLDHAIMTDDDEDKHRFLEEEIFEQEGTYEELLAYDNQEEEYLVEHNKRLNLTKRRRHGLPPITPKASMRDLVNNFLFDFMWSALIDWSIALIKEYSKSIVDTQMTMESLTRTNTDISSASDQQQSQQQQKPVNQSVQKSTEQTNLGAFNSSNNPTIGTSKNGNSNVILNPIQIQALKTNAGGLHAPLKPFDPPLNNQAYFSNSEKPVQQSSFTPGSMSRDNSTLFNSQLSRYNTIINSGEHVHEGKLVDEAIAKYLQIKQLNTFGNSASKNLVPISSGSRIGSGKLQQQPQQQQQQQQQQNRGTQHYQLGKKRFSSIEVVSSSISNQQQQQQPTSTSALGLATTVSSSSQQQQQQQTNQMSIHGNALGHKPEPSSSSSSSHGLHHHHNSNNNNRSGNNSTMLHHHHHDGSDDLVIGSGGESSLLDGAAGNEIMSIDEINLINGSGSGNSMKQASSSAHVHFYPQPQNQSNSVNFLQQLPPIGKPTRISSASNVNTNKERSERPLTSTAIRIDSMNFPLHKRSTTPSGLASSNKVQNYYQSMKRRFNVSLDDPFHINNNPNMANTLNIVNSFSNFLSTKSFNNMAAQNPQQASSTVNRRNSIKESQRSGHK